MRKRFMSVCLLAGCVVLFPATTPAQEVIHALTGTISAINTSNKTITVFQDNGSSDTFPDMVNHKTAISFDKKIQADTVAATAFDKQGAYAIVFYYGDSDDRTVVAVKSLGPGPFEATTGEVVKMDGHAHAITLRDKTGAEHTFHIDEKTVAEGYDGAVPGLKFQAQRGDQVRIVSTKDGANSTALFLRQM